MAERGEGLTTRAGSARAEVLGRVAAALATAAVDAPPPSEPPPGARAADRVGRFLERLAEYGASVQRAGEDELPRVLGEVLGRHGARRLAVPSGVPAAWLPAELEAVGDEPPLTPRQLDELDGVLTGCALAIAETGTVALDHSSGQGRRALTLLPDLHVCVVDPATIVDDVPEALAALAEPIAAGRPVTLVSGPSATSDIELNRVEGVHGPRRLEVILLHQAPGG